MQWLSVIVLNAVLLSGAFAAPMGIDYQWDGVSDPLIMSSTFERRFSKMPASGKVADPNKFWSGDYWALYLGNINYRWNSTNKTGYGLRSPSKQMAMSMTQEQLAELAPSEKFDLFTGRYDYPLRNDVYDHSYPRAADWEGICHGWAPATMNHKEPKPKIMVNPDGIKIPFGSSDIKGLLSYYYAYKNEVETTNQMGERCYGRRCYMDLNAGAFHIVLANKVGIEKVGFLGDLDKTWEVWNHPVNAYKSTIVNEFDHAFRYSAYGTVKVVRVKTEMTYVDESTVNTWQPVIGTPGQINKVKNYEYYLELDNKGEIIGGEWISSEYPDFLWLTPKVIKFKGMMSRLGELLNDK